MWAILTMADACIMADRGFNVADCVGSVDAIVL